VKLDAIRAVIAATAYRPFEARTRVIVIDEADGLLTDSQDALLKSLEEPAAATVFVLVSSRPEMLLPTVRSRCSRVRFGRLSAGEVASLLMDRHGLDEHEARAAAAVADGSVGRALDAQSRGFRVARDAALEVLRVAAAAGTPSARLRAAQALIPARPSSAGEREDVAVRATVLSSLLRDVAMIRGGGSRADLANADLADELARLADRFETSRLLEAFASVERSVALLRRNAGPKIVADWLAVRL
jgi:DNA polymerase-3 subunit delta'